MTEKQPKRITLGLVISWIFGILFGLNALAYLVYRQFVPAIISLVVFVVIFPPISKLIQEKFNIELSKGIKIAVVIIGIVIIVFTADINKINPQSQTSDQEVLTQPKTQEKPKEIIVVSNSFDDFSILCDSDVTNLQKKDFFDKNFKDNYVEWTGEVSSISESFGQYVLQVKHCPLTFTSDIMVTMKKDQKDKLLSFREGDTVTYRAKLTRIGDILGMSATDGEVIKIEERTEEKSDEITGDVVKETKQETTKTEDFKFSPNSIVETRNGISLSLDNLKYELKKENWGKITEMTVTILNKGNNNFQPKVLVLLYDEKDPKEEWTTPKAEIEFDMWQLDVGEHVTKKAITNIVFNDLDLPKKLQLVLVDAYDWGNRAVVVVEKEFIAK